MKENRERRFMKFAEALLLRARKMGAVNNYDWPTLVAVPGFPKGQFVDIYDANLPVLDGATL